MKNEDKNYEECKMKVRTITCRMKVRTMRTIKIRNMKDLKRKLGQYYEEYRIKNRTQKNVKLIHEGFRMKVKTMKGKTMKDLK